MLRPAPPRRPMRPPEAPRRRLLERAIAGRIELGAKRQVVGRGEDHRDVPCRLPPLVAADVPAPCVDIPVRGAYHDRRTRRIVRLIESQGAFHDGNEDWPWVRV